MDVIDRLNHRMTQLRNLGVKIRCEDLQGNSGGLCEVNGQKILLVEVALPSAEQLEIFEQTLAHLHRSGRAVA